MPEPRRGPSSDSLLRKSGLGSQSKESKRMGWGERRVGTGQKGNVAAGILGWEKHGGRRGPALWGIRHIGVAHAGFAAAS